MRFAGFSGAASEWIEAQSCSSPLEIKASDVMIGK